MSDLTLSAIALACGKAIGQMDTAQQTVVKCRETANDNAIALFNKNAVTGTYKKDGTGCALCTAFVDGGVAEGKTLGTMQKTYLPAFKQVVKTGKALSDWNLQRNKPKSGKANAAKGKKEFADKLATVYRDSEFEGFITDLEASWDNGEIDHLIEGIKSYLEASGVKLKA